MTLLQKVRTIKNNVGKEINDIVETNRNELEHKSNDNVGYNNENKIITVEERQKRPPEVFCKKRCS